MSVVVTSGRSNGLSGAMRALCLLLVLELPCAAIADDLLWLEREWVSDADASMSANSVALQRMPAQTKNKFKSLYGKIRWRFQDGNFYFKSEGAESGPSPYSLRPIDDERFEIIVTDVMTIEVTKTLRGFCVQWPPTWVSEVKSWTESSWIDCFAPYGA
jgi:hypothetical protein